jgi:hypothetical protein
MGPAAPIFVITFLFGKGSLKEMKAPNVPIEYASGIKGMKKGREALTL